MENRDSTTNRIRKLELPEWDLPNVIKLSPHVFNEIITTLKHARIFISTRQKMHPDGIKLHEDLITNLEDLGKEKI